MENINLKKFFILLMSMILIISFISLPVSAQTSNISEQQKVDKVAAMLKFIYEEASTKDKNGNIIDMDVNKISEKYGDTQELKQLKKEIMVDQKPTSYRSFNSGKFKSCITSAVADQFGVGVVTAIMEGGFYAYMKKKAYKEAAKLLLKFAIGSNLVGLSAFTAYYGGKCAAYANS